MIFKSEQTQKMFDSWLTISGGISPNDSDMQRFCAFAITYYLNGENVTKNSFVKECKKVTHTSRSVNRGICQQYYMWLDDIVNFLKYSKIPL